MKEIVFVFICFAAAPLCFGQHEEVKHELNRYLLDTASIGRLQKDLREAKQDTSRIRIMRELIVQYSNNLDSSLYYCFKQLSLSRKINFHKGELNALGQLLNSLKHHGLLLKAFNICYKGLHASREYGDKFFEATFMGEEGILYRDSGIFPEALTYLNQSRDLYDSIGEEYYAAYQLDNIGEVYLLKNELDSALFFCRAALKKLKGAPASDFWMTFYTSVNLGNIFRAQANYDSSLYYLKSARKIAGFHAHQFNTNLSIAKVFEKLGMEDSLLYYAGNADRVALESGVYSFNAEVNEFLGKFYYNRDINKSTQFTRRSLEYKDSLYRQSVLIALENFDEADEQERQFEIKTAQATYQFKARLIGILSGVLVLLVIMGILIRNYRQKQKSIILLNKQKDELNTAKEKTDIALTNLKSTQSQLIQSEKMASLGELTAAIAHEIQNPLNFVNNFSEINAELIDELNDEIVNGNRQAIDKITADIKANEEKISFHGKRADAIVKGMLLHSRGRSEETELVDINSLCDEYLRLAFHGFRAKDKSFSATFKTVFDTNAPKVNAVRQDIGRVLLNLINNAFYAVRESAVAPTRIGTMTDKKYEPTVWVNTKILGDKVEIRVGDNGNGIPDEIKAKIFQPFFSTKPTGQGTGLGLSLSYDIVKAHGGELKFETRKNEGTVFIVNLSV